MAEKVLYGLTSDTFKSIQFGAGAVFRNLEYQDVKSISDFNTMMQNAVTSGQMLGATDGGININISATYGRPSIDGLGSIPFRGGLLPESLECYIEMTLKEVSPSKMQSIFPTSRFINETSTSVISQRINLNISDEDYCDNICWIGTTNFGFILISLFNAFGRANGAIGAVDGIAGGGIPFRADGNVANFDETEFIPAEVLYVYREITGATSEIGKIDTYKVMVNTP